MAQFHKVAQGECLATIAQQYRMNDYRVIYDHPKNAALKLKRPNPNILAEGDTVYIPDNGNKQTDAGTAKQHSFSIKGPTLRYCTVVRDGRGKPLANAAYTLKMEEKILTGKTDSGGLLKEDIPIAAESALLTLPELKMTWNLRFGHLDPVETLTGIQARLNGLGYAAGDAGQDGPPLQSALSAFQKDMGLPVTGTSDKQTQAKLKAVFGC